MNQPTIDEVVKLLKAMLESDSLMGRITDQQVEDGWVLITRLEQHGIAPPDGWVLVPADPTKRMLMCFKHEWITNQANECYEMLLAVAPKPEMKL